MSSIIAPPSLNFQMGHRLSDTDTGFVEYDTGNFSSWTDGFLQVSSPCASIGLVRQRNDLELEFRIFAENSRLGLSLSRKRSFQESMFFGRDVKFISQVKVDTFYGPLYHLGLDKSLGDYGKFGLGVDTSQNGVFLKFR